MKDNIILDKLMQSSRIKNLGLRRESILDILNIYEDIVLGELLEKGHTEIGSGMIVEVVKLLDRVHVLRGVSYKSSRKYKLKLTMDESLYKKIEGYYDKLKEEIL